MRPTLLQAAEVIVCAEMHPAPLSEDQAAGLDSAVKTGLINITDDQVSFATPELLVTWIARYCAVNISDVWQDLDKAIQALRMAQVLPAQLSLPASLFNTQMIVSLEKDCGRNVLARLLEAARIEVGPHEADHSLKAIYFAFCDALPEFDYQPKDLADQLEPVLRATESYRPAGHLHGAIERLAGQSQEKAEALVKAFLQRPELRTIELAANALKELWTFDPAGAHRQAMDLAEAKLPALQRVGAIALACFNYNCPSHEGELTATINRLELLCESNDPDLVSVIAHAFGVLFSAPDDGNTLRHVTEGILRLASHGEPAVQSAVARVLFQRTDDSGDADWFWDALGRLSSVSARHKGTLGRLDSATYSMVERYPERVARHLEDVVTNRPYGMEGEKDRLPDLYENTVIRLIEKQQPELESNITRWFASRDPRLHAAAADIVNSFVKEARQEPNRAIRLDSTELNALDEDGVQRLTCALMGWVDDFKALASLLISVLSRKHVSERVRELIVIVLADVVLYNMPGSVGDYLRSLAQHTDTPEHVRQIVEDALTRSDAYYAPLKGRPNLKELAPPDIRVHRHRAANKQHSQSTWENVFNESGFLSMIPITPVKYGRASFSDEGGNAASSIPMRTIRTEQEVPRELIIDPVGRRIRRFEMRQMAVAGLPVESASGAVNDTRGPNEEKETEKA